MNIKTFDIKSFINRYESSITDERNDRRKQTNEVFTPFEIIERMCEMIPEESWSDPEKTFLEPTFVNGNIVLYILWRRMATGIDWQTAVKTLYGTELMKDNCLECKARVKDLFDSLGLSYDKNELSDMLDMQLVNTDFFNWDFDNWKPIETGKKQESNEVTLF